MNDLPPPDLRDSTGRMRRIVISLLIGIAGAALGYVIASRTVDTTPDGADRFGKAMSAGTFVIWVSLAAAVASFAIALVVQNHLAKKATRAERVPPARVV